MKNISPFVADAFLQGCNPCRLERSGTFVTDTAPSRAVKSDYFPFAWFDVTSFQDKVQCYFFIQSRKISPIVGAAKKFLL